ncbi:MAG: FAD-dependent oxidoreductase, partial [Actinomycetota bacterium]
MSEAGELSYRWGTPKEPVTLEPDMREFLREHVGIANPWPAQGAAQWVLPKGRLSADDLAALASVVGEDHVATDRVSRLAHLGGASYTDYARRRSGDAADAPDAVVSPDTHEQVVDVLRLCSARGIAVVPLGGGTSVVGGLRAGRSIARTAASYGARILTRTRALSVNGDGARVRDALTGESYDIQARHVIVATGVWTGDLDPDTRILASRGSHALLDPRALGYPRAALTVPVPDERGRYVFALPTTDGPVIAGITDEPEPAPMPDVPTAPESDIAWILQHLSSALSEPLTSDDVIGTYAGLRPLVAPPDGSESGDTADISRRHLVTRTPDGAVVITGGKLTTYRRMAQDAVDALGIDERCITATTPLVGAQPYRTPAPVGVPPRLVRHYGSEAPRVAAWSDDDPSLLQPVAAGVPVLGVEVVHALRAEGALSLDDVLERRTRLSVTPQALARARERIAEIARGADPDV